MRRVIENPFWEELGVGAWARIPSIWVQDHEASELTQIEIGPIPVLGIERLPVRHLRELDSENARKMKTGSSQ